MKRIIYLLLASMLFTLLPNNIYADENVDTDAIETALTSSSDIYNEYCPNGYCIKNYLINIVVNENNSFDVTEYIDVFFTEDKHGIFRKLPIKNHVLRNDGTSSTNIAKISKISVNQEYVTYIDDNYKVIKIGDADTTLVGDQHYEIKYNYSIGKDKLKGLDELYLDIIGTEWDTIIDNVSFKITMPKEFDTDKIGFSTGIKGTVGTNHIKYDIDGKMIIGVYDGKLEPYEGITIRMELPDGYFKYEYRFNYIELLVIIVPIIFAYISYFIFKQSGIDDPINETVEFFPPNDYNCLDIDYYYNSESTYNGVSSLLIYLANKGYIKITDTDEYGNKLKHNNFIITKLKDYNGNDPREKLFLEQLFKKKKKYTFWGREINDDNNEEITKIEKKDLTNNFYKTSKLIMKMTNSKERTQSIIKKGELEDKAYIIIMFLLSVILYISNLFNYGFDYQDLLVYGILIICCIIYWSIALSLILLRFLDKNQFKNSTTDSTNLIIIISYIIFGIIFTSIVFLVPKTYDNIFYGNTLLFVGTIITTISLSIMLTCKRGLVKRTQFGSEILGRVKGFKKFIENADETRLKDLNYKNSTYFYDILPYTYLFNDSKNWIKKFENIPLDKPQWYDSNTSDSAIQTIRDFMDDTFSAISNSLNSSPNDSDISSGGSSSGGGSMGGGGGSW